MPLKLLYLYRNITRNKLRAALTCMAVALPITIFVLSMAVIDGINRFLDNSSKQLRLVVSHKSSIINPLPRGHRAKIESLDPTRARIVSVCGVRWIGGQVQDKPHPLSTLAVDHDTFPQTFSDYGLSEDELAAWRRDRQAIILGRSTAQQFNWDVGMRININPSVPPYTPFEFKVISTAQNSVDPVTNICRLDYIEEMTKEAVTMAPEDWKIDGWASFFFVKCGSQADLEYFRTAIDELFARTPDETRTQDEKTFINEFIKQQFDLPRNLTILASVTVFVAVMAAANTMSMNLRDRMNETAILKSLGFSGKVIFGLIQWEGLALCMSGGFLGAAVPYLLFTYSPLRNYTVPLIQTLEIQPIVCGYAMLIAMMIGVVASTWPAIVGLRMPVIAALRNLE